MTAHTSDPVEELLAAALAQARTDDRWAVPVRPQALTAVRRAATRRRARSAGFALAGVAAAAGGAAAVGAAQTGPVDEVRVEQPAAEGTPEPVPGISPAWTPTSGREWVLDRDDYAAFEAAHTLPSPAPHDVASPAPLTEMSARLEQEVRTAAPPGTTLERQDALNGQAGTAGIHARLADGTPLEVARIPLQQPLTRMFGGDGPQPPTHLRDLPTGSVLVTIAGAGYGWPPGIPADANVAMVITPRGLQTTWTAPLSVPLDTIAEWAVTADAG